MDIEKAFDNAQTLIKDGHYDKVRPIVDEIAASADDAFTLLKCASLLKVVDDEDGCQELLDKVAAIPQNTPEDRLTAAASLRGLGRADDAYGMIKNDDETDAVLREKAMALLMMDEGEEALSKIRKLSSTNAADEILLTNILCSLGEFREAYEIASKLVEKENASYDSLVSLCTVMILMGKNKDAIKTAKRHMKEEKNVNSLALAAYVMRINGRIPAAANYAHRAMSMDHTHKGALETMAMCFVEKSRFIEAKVLAGAINERTPGDPAAIRILDACRSAKTDRGRK
ncbi:MAG: hypothetical protein FWH44_04955 [Methanomassiliicoccaceae archaeon]|nr:hypothetical protein [Methanomassiliicoccaceae archaeon]